MTEILPIPGFEGFYSVTDDGHVYSEPRLVNGKGNKPKRVGGYWLKSSPNPFGYPHVNLYKFGKVYSRCVHVLVAEAFIGPRPGGMEVCHNNGDCTDNRVSNLRWDTRSANRQDALRHGTHKPSPGSRNGRSKLVEDQVIEIRHWYAIGEISQKELAEYYAVKPSLISQIVNRKIWRHI